MKKIAATEAKNQFGHLLEMVLTKPVTIEKKGRPVAVILCFAEYQRLTEIEERFGGDRALNALESGFLSENEAKTRLREKL